MSNRTSEQCICPVNDDCIIRRDPECEAHQWADDYTKKFPREQPTSKPLARPKFYDFDDAIEYIGKLEAEIERMRAGSKLHLQTTKALALDNDRLQSNLDAAIATAKRREERLRAGLAKAKRSHYYCEDSWYSCPKAEDGCANEYAGTDCNCGADSFNAEIDALVGAAVETPALQATDTNVESALCDETPAVRDDPFTTLVTDPIIRSILTAIASEEANADGDN